MRLQGYHRYYVDVNALKESRILEENIHQKAQLIFKHA